MRLTFNRSKMQKAFAVAASVAASKNCPKPILSKVKLVAGPEGVTLNATDLEIGVSIEVDGCEVDGGQCGAMLLPTEQFSKMISECRDDVMTLDSGGIGDPLTVSGERSQLKLPTMNPDEFPDVKTGIEGGECCQVPAWPLRELISRTIFACDEASSRYALGGVLLDRDNDELVGVATDGRRLAATRVTAPLAVAAKDRKPSVLTTIVPGKALRAIQRVLPDSGEATLAVYENHIVIVAAGVRLYSRLVEGKFPKWRDVLPNTDGCLSIDLPATVLLSAVRQAAIVATQESRGMNFTFSDGTLVVACDTAEVGTSNVELPIAGQDGVEPVTVTLDHIFVAEFLKVAGDSSITIHIRDGESAVLFALDSYRYVVMPLSRE